MPIRIRIRLPRRKPRPGFFSLTAEPKLWQDGPLRGQLDYVVFTALTTDGLQMWHAYKNGNLIADFSALVPEQRAINLVKKLYGGWTVRVPGRHSVELLQGRFGFNVTSTPV
jgi:hypothetical protein